MLKLNITFARAASILALIAATACTADPDVVFEGGPSNADATTTTDTGTGTDTNTSSCAGLACDDNDPCTDDTCKAGKCTFAAITGYTCDDGKACTEGDVCHQGTCIGSIKNCSDGDACTSDGCNPTTGKCASTVISGCEPNDPCLAMDCDDGNPCTDDFCGINGCVNTADDGNSCVTGTACTTADHCFMGNCIGDSISCDDGNPCTMDSCNSFMGCEHEAVGKGWVCDDGNIGTVNDQCVGSSCVGTTAQTDLCKGKVCNDGNKCTDDQCNPATGKCESFGWTPFCCNSDADCTDSCLVGKCLSDGCNFSGKDCNDGNACTADSCMFGTGCVHTPIPGCGQPTPECTTNAQCVDNTTCTADTCVNGKCENTPIANCGQPSNQPSYQLTVTWVGNAAAKAAFTAAGYNSLSLGGYCKGVSNGQVSGPDVVAWSEKLPLAEGATVDKMVFTKQVQSLAKCEFQVYAWNGNSQVAWGAFAGENVLGSLSYVWDGYSATNVGIATNGKGGYNWAFSPGNDTDGDGVVDSLDSSKFNGAVK